MITMTKRIRAKKTPALFANIPARSVLVVLMRDVRGTPAEKLVILDRLKVAGRLKGHDPVALRTCEDLLRTLASESEGRIS